MKLKCGLWVAMDSDGEWWVYLTKPKLDGDEWRSDDDNFPSAIKLYPDFFDLDRAGPAAMSLFQTGSDDVL